MQGKERKPFHKATPANYKELYSTFKKVFHKYDTETILKDLYKYAKVYSYIIEDVSSKNIKVDYQLSDLRRINISTSYSLLLMILMKWEEKELTDEEIINILDAFRIYGFRKRLIGQAAGENKAFVTLINKIPELVKAANKKAKMFEILANQDYYLRIPNDIELANHLHSCNFFNFNYRNLLLAMVEEKITKARPDLSDERLQLEHIMPQKLNEEWKKMLGENYENIHQEFVHNIGNLTLIRQNQELGNKPFEFKKDVYENKAGLQIAKTHIINHDKWDDKAIMERNEWITNYILQDVLPIPGKMRKTNNFMARKNKKFSFRDLQLIGCDINFIDDTNITARVINDKEVSYEGKKYKLSTLTREIYERNGRTKKTGSYRGHQYWEFDGIRLSDMI